MRPLLWILTALLLPAVPALEPRKSVAQYASRSVADSAEIGVTALRPDEVARLFSAVLNRDYIVVEVAVYPTAGQPVSFSPDDFTLRIDGSRLVKPVDAASVLAAVPLPPPDVPPKKPGKKRATRLKKAASQTAAERLAADALRSTTSSSAFAGFLYFPVAGSAGARFEIEYFGGLRRLRLPLLR